MSSAAELLFNPLDPSLAADPYPVYARLRDLDPVHRSPLGLWVLSRHPDCHAILRHPAASSDQRHSVRYRSYVELAALTPEQEALLAAQPMLFRDPPDHTRLRRLASSAFTARVVERMRPRVQAIVDDILDTPRADRQMDVIDELAYPVPVRVIGELLGVPRADQARLKEWSSVLVAGLNVSFAPPAEDVGRIAAGEAFNDYFRDLISRRRRDPQEDLLSKLIAAEDSGDSLSEAELLSTCVLLLIAGHETTANVIGNGLRALLEHRDQLAILRDDPTRMRRGVEELLRFDPPVQLTARVATDAIEIGGVVIEPGEMMLLLIGAANRDPGVFARPERLDVTRDPNQHLTFGSGIHLCLGAPLARLEADVVLTTLLRRMPDLDFADDDHSYRAGLVLRGLRSLGVCW